MKFKSGSDPPPLLNQSNERRYKVFVMTHVIKNGSNKIGSIWLSNGKHVLTLKNDVKIDFDEGLRIIELKTSKEIYINIFDVIMSNLKELYKIKELL